MQRLLVVTMPYYAVHIGLIAYLNYLTKTFKFDGMQLMAIKYTNQTICSITGNARSILTAERSALNFLQTLSGTATTTHAMVNSHKTYKRQITRHT